MKVAQLLLDGASHYERKSQRIDATLPGVELVDDPSGFDVAHVYGPWNLPRRRIGVPYVANASMPQRWWQPRIPQPRTIVTPFEVPEAVDDAYFQDAAPSTQHNAIGVFARPSVKNVIEQTMHRLDRTRDDITWLLFDAPPSPDEMASVGVWVDPAIDEDDYDGFTAEALAAGRVVIASRTPINLHRAEKGRTALLVPRNDPNELTHAILTGLFKPEVGQQRAIAARQTISKFRARQRHRVLAALYEKSRLP